MTHKARLPLVMCVLVLLAGYCVAEERQCSSVKRRVGEVQVDVAPPPGFVDICALDTELCTLVTRDWWPSRQTLAWFVTAEDWALYEKEKNHGFTHHLVVQLIGDMSEDKFRENKQFVHKYTVTPARIQLPERCETRGRADLGVVAETNDSISFGSVSSMVPSRADPSVSVCRAATNTTVRVKEKGLSLYALRKYTNPDDAKAVIALTTQWIQCIVALNR